MRLKKSLFASVMIVVAGVAAIGWLSSNNLEETIPTLSQELSSKSSTYGELLRNRSYVPIDAETDNDTIRNLILVRMFPNYQSNHIYKRNQLFAGSPEIKLTGSFRKNSENKRIFVFEKEKLEKVEELKQACINVLKSEAKDAYNSLSKLAEWCTIPKIKHVLKRHKFELNKIDEDWAKTLYNFKPEFAKYQSFFSQEEITKIEKAKNNLQQQIKIIRDRCNKVLEKNYERSNFPAPKAFLVGQEADEFQEAALFCTKEKSAGDYVSQAMKGLTKAGNVPKRLKNDYCYVQGKDDIEYYKSIKTTDLEDGRGFWCAVRIVYDRYRNN